jgi:hypothetical protein
MRRRLLGRTIAAFSRPMRGRIAFWPVLLMAAAGCFVRRPAVMGPIVLRTVRALARCVGLIAAGISLQRIKRLSFTLPVAGAGRVGAITGAALLTRAAMVVAMFTVLPVRTLPPFSPVRVAGP